jgi:hypothetical protein
MDPDVGETEIPDNPFESLLIWSTGACERGYYCAWQEFGGKVWCCEDVSRHVPSDLLRRHADRCKGTKLGRMRRSGIEHVLNNKRADILRRAKLLRDNGSLDVGLLHIGLLDQRDGNEISDVVHNQLAVSRIYRHLMVNNYSDRRSSHGDSDHPGGWMPLVILLAHRNPRYHLHVGHHYEATNFHDSPAGRLLLRLLDTTPSNETISGG